MQGRKPYREERKVFEWNGLDSRDWLVQKSNISYIQVINKSSGEVRQLFLCKDNS